MAAQPVAPPPVTATTLATLARHNAAEESYPFAPTLTGTTLARPMPSRSTPGLTHDAPWRDIVTGVWECPPSCQGRRKDGHSHQRALATLGAQLTAIARDGRRLVGLVVLDLRQQLARTARLTDGMLALQVEWLTPHDAYLAPLLDGSGEYPVEAFPLTIAWVAACLVRDDRAALAEAARHTARAVA